MMAHLVPALELQLALPVWPCIFASDAEGANRQDAGGCGVDPSGNDETMFRSRDPTSIHSHKAGWNVTSVEKSIARVGRTDPHLKIAFFPFLQRNSLGRSLAWEMAQSGAHYIGRRTSDKHLASTFDRTPSSARSQVLEPLRQPGVVLGNGQGQKPSFPIQCTIAATCRGAQCSHPWLDTSRMPADALSRRE